MEVAPSPTTPPSLPSLCPRMPWIDHLRTFVILLVVHLHACVTYSHVGSWYVNEGPDPSFAAKIPFIVWENVLQSFFMGILFFVAGYFAYGALGRRGPGGFARERLFRLGVPTLLYMLVIHPFILLVLNPWNYGFGPWVPWYLHFLRSGRWLSASGPMWFALALLIFSLAWAAGGRGWTRRPGPAAGAPPSGRAVLGFALVLAAANFLLRLEWPLGTSVLNLQLCYFSQYVGGFLVGLAAARHGWLVPLARSPLARRAGWTALAAGPVSLLLICFLLLRFGIGTEDQFHGGWYWQTALLASWEQLTGVGLGLGLLYFFATRLDRESAGARWLSDRSFAVYLLHPPILVALTMLYRGLPGPRSALALLLTVTGLVVSFLAADLARRLPLLRSVL